MTECTECLILYLLIGIYRFVTLTLIPLSSLSVCAIGGFYKLALLDFEAIFEVNLQVNEGIMRA